MSILFVASTLCVVTVAIAPFVLRVFAPRWART
jgi:hypothetical protein